MNEYTLGVGGAVPDHDWDEVARLQAIAADRGVTVRTIESDDGVTIWASRWGLSRAFPNIASLREWLVDLGIGEAAR